MNYSKQRGFATLYLYAGAAIAFVVLLGLVKLQTERLRLATAQHKTFVEQIETQGKAAQERIRLEKDRQNRLEREIQNEYKSRLAAVSAAYDKLRKSGSGIGSVPPLSAAATSSQTCPGSDIAGILERVEKGVLGVLEKGDSEITKFWLLWKRDSELAEKQVK